MPGYVPEVGMTINKVSDTRQPTLNQLRDQQTYLWFRKCYYVYIPDNPFEEGWQFPQSYNPPPFSSESIHHT